MTPTPTPTLAFIEGMYSVYCCSDDSFLGYTDDTFGIGVIADNTNSQCWYTDGSRPTGGTYFDWTLLDLVSIVDCDDEMGPSYCQDPCPGF